MPFHGSREYLCFEYPPRSPVENMARAIVRIYTKDGFVIAADGRMSIEGLRVAHEVVNEHTQKIFPISGPDRSAACIFSGNVGITSVTSKDEILVDIVKETIEELQATSNRKYPSLMEFSARIGRRLKRAIRVAQETAKWSHCLLTI